MLSVSSVGSYLRVSMRQCLRWHHAAGPQLAASNFPLLPAHGGGELNCSRASLQGGFRVRRNREGQGWGWKAPQGKAAPALWRSAIMSVNTGGQPSTQPSEGRGLGPPAAAPSRLLLGADKAVGNYPFEKQSIFFRKGHRTLCLKITGRICLSQSTVPSRVEKALNLFSHCCKHLPGTPQCSTLWSAVSA